MTDRVGQQFGNYRLNRLLGQGAFAEVYLGEHVYLETQAAIKILRTQVGKNGQGQFLKEARTIARLDHPHIVRVLDFGIEQNAPYLVMAYATGGTIRVRHPKGEQLSLTAILPYMEQIAEALEYLHTQKLVHRDLKPENVLMSSLGQGRGQAPPLPSIVELGQGRGQAPPLPSIVEGSNVSRRLRPSPMQGPNATQWTGWWVCRYKPGRPIFPIRANCNQAVIAECPSSFQAKTAGGGACNL